MIPLSAPKFAAGWLPALVASAAVPPPAQLADMFAVQVNGVTVPLLTCGLGLLGVLVARPLARKAESARGWGSFLLVTAIMLVAVELWIVESRPPALFAFVVAIGLGFSGYSLIELIGEQVKSFISGIVDAAKARLPGASKED